MAKAFVESKVHLQDLERLAEDTFASRDDALNWLLKPHPLLAGASPRQVAQTDDGAKTVHSMLISIKYGGVV